MWTTTLSPTTLTKTRAEFLLNGRPVSIDSATPQTTLLDFIRALGLTGAKEGCAEGECGACAVVMVSDDDGRTTYRTVNSCLMFVPMAAGREIHTVESLAANGQLADVQQAMAAAGGSQCGYCTPGFVMSLFAEQYRPGRTGPCDPMALSGNLCRCTGYRPIRDAARSIGPAPDDEFHRRLKRPAPALDRVTLDGFSRPATLDECTALLRDQPDATLIAGGTDLCVESNLRAQRWRHLVSLEAVRELREFTDEGESVRIGAGLSLTEVGARWRSAPPVVREWLDLFASPLIRNRATLGGNLATASPIGDSAPLLLALDASLDIAGPNGRRIVPLASFFEAYRRTALRAGEVLANVVIPKPLPQTLRFYKVAKRRVDDISTVAAAIGIDLDNSGRVSRARIAFGGVAATPVRVTPGEDALLGQPWNEAAVEAARQAIAGALTPMSDHRGSADYRLQVSSSLIEKFWWETRA